MLARRLDIDFDPLAAFAAVDHLSGVALLHSGVQAYGLGRFSILAVEPWKRVRYRNGWLEVEQGGRLERRQLSLLQALQLELGVEKVERRGPLPFYGGGIGYIAYDAARYLEPILGESIESEACVARFSFYRAAIIFDHEEREVYLTGQDEAALASGEAFVQKVSEPRSKATPDPFRLTSGLLSNFGRGEYEQAVDRVRQYIRDGDVYQVNLSQRFSANCVGSPAELFLRLASRNPAPYAAYLDFDGEQIVSSSPEQFLKIEGQRVVTRPIKGTRPLGATEAATEAYSRELAESEKDRSELLMIVDLERNDLGRVCQPGTVEVAGLFAQERYATVIHQTAEVFGSLEDGVGLAECLAAMFPGGSITGAPKIRAMQVIDELERGRRGIYTGAIGYLDASGDAEFNIAIRTIRIAGRNLEFQVGGGIVWDSDPKCEYEETLVKAKAIMEAIGGEYVE